MKRKLANNIKIPVLAVLAVGVLFCLLCSSCCRQKMSRKGNALTVSVDKKRVTAGDSVNITVTVLRKCSPDKLQAFLIQPLKGVKSIALRPDEKNPNLFHGTVLPGDNTTEGFHGITVVENTGNRKLTGKAWYLFGKVVGDYSIMSNFPDTNCRVNMLHYLNQFVAVGGNMITLHANIGTEAVWGGPPVLRAVWPSKVCRNAVSPKDDRIETMLRLTDSIGVPSLISVTWDLTDTTLPNTRYMENINAIIRELWGMYGSHPSLIGFYDSQEGSGTYFAAHIRQFCKLVKNNNPGLLTMCAPNIDDPLLAGYLAAIDDLDVINYQAPIMTSYRPDNRQMYPNRRLNDVTSLSAGATRVRDKVTLSHIEFMGYIENKVKDAYLTTYENIFNQFPSAASAYGPDGVTFFGYFSCIFFNEQKYPVETASANQGVKDGMKAYKLITREITNQPTHIAVYIPYNDWCIERWKNCITPALDALEKMGIPHEVIPFIPKKGEDILPFYPMNKNMEQLNYLLKNKYVILLTDISGMQETDSEMLEAFVKQGGTVIAFGPRIPYGDRFNREKLWGAKELTPIQAGKKFDRIIVKNAGPRTKPGQAFSFAPCVSTSWEPSTEGRIANFADGTASVFSNNYGNGKTYVIALSVKDAANAFPDLVRDVFDKTLIFYGIRRPFDVAGMSQGMDVSMNGTGEECLISLANYSSVPVKVAIKPLLLDNTSDYTLTDLKSGMIISEKTGENYSSISVTVEGNNYMVLKLSRVEGK